MDLRNLERKALHAFILPTFSVILLGRFCREILGLYSIATITTFSLALKNICNLIG